MIKLMRAIALCAALALAGLAQGQQGTASGYDSGVGPAEERAKVHTQLGLAYFQAGRMAVALDEANAALAADGKYAAAYNLLGLVHMYLRENARARMNFEKAHAIAPQDPEINNNYGWFLCQNGAPKDSFGYFMTAVKDPLYTTPTKPYYNAGMCALLANDVEAAEDYFTKAAMADRNNVHAFYRLADIKYRKGNLLDAQRFVAEVMRIGQPDPAAIWLALRIERKIGNRAAETGYANQLRWKFQGSPEYQAMTQGKFE